MKSKQTGRSKQTAELLKSFEFSFQTTLHCVSEALSVIITKNKKQSLLYLSESRVRRDHGQSDAVADDGRGGDDELGRHQEGDVVGREVALIGVGRVDVHRVNSLNSRPYIVIRCATTIKDSNATP